MEHLALKERIQGSLRQEFPHAGGKAGGRGR
jgi:hypothetical protein